VGCVNSKKYIQVEIEYMKEEEYQVLKDNWASWWRGLWREKVGMVAIEVWVTGLEVCIKWQLQDCVCVKIVRLIRQRYGWRNTESLLIRGIKSIIKTYLRKETGRTFSSHAKSPLIVYPSHWPSKQQLRTWAWRRYFQSDNSSVILVLAELVWQNDLHLWGTDKRWSVLG
jgi:hypothetical protein